jgi:hypothetical protein
MSDFECLIFYAADGPVLIEMRLEDETVCLTQYNAYLFGKSKKII